MSQTVTLEVFSDNDALDGYDCFVVEIDTAYATRLLDLMKMVEELQAQDSNIYELRVWDYSGDYYPRDYDREDDEIKARPGAEASRVEVCLALIGKDSVEWRAVAKHTDCEVRTISLMKSELEQIVQANEAEVKA